MYSLKRFLILLCLCTSLFLVFNSVCLAKKRCSFSFEKAPSNPGIYIGYDSRSSISGLILGVAPKKGNILYVTTYGNLIYVYVEKGSEFYVFYLDDVVVCRTPN